MATNYDVLLEKIRALGMDYRWAGMFVKKLRDDENAFPVADEKRKKWALEKGFFPGRIELYGLTEDNWDQYVPDYQYFMLHPLPSKVKYVPSSPEARFSQLAAICRALRR